MNLSFRKYQGAGNDFIIIDNRSDKIKLTEAQICRLCDRRFGIGADGLMLLENHSDFDFKMFYFNSDGKESTMCGNGGRCLAAFAKSLNIVTKDANFIATDGPHKAIVNDINSVSLQMKDVDDLRIVNTNYFIDTGSPHYVTFRDDISNIDVYKRGKEIRNSGVFAPKGTNVNFVEIQGEKLFVRTYERGVEDETLACGTGVTAAAISASFYTDNDKNSYDIITKGGNLKVSFKKQNDNTFTDIWLTGSATFVFKGEIDI
ncbi:MAG: diaminopimelate epimerase [Bacteroidales bacterium]|jgi:diaminopimelate epimerase|nr:diaminopimelate epimerase [Bacteroidales bacterium]